MSKKRKLRVGRFLFVLFIFLVIIIICFRFVDIKIQSVEIKGNNILTDYEVLKQSKLINYPSFLTTFTYNIRKDLLKNNYIQKADVKKGFLNIKITIKEKKILYIDYLTSNKITINSSFKDKKSICVPILTNNIPSDKLYSFKKEMNKINKNTLCQISEVRYDPNEIDKDRFFMYMNDGNGVYLTMNKFKKINEYNEILENIGKNNGVLYLDYGDYFTPY